MFESDSELRAKHRELQELQENRTLKLHDAIHQLEAKLTESNHKMIILKEDYAYNLELLEAKDHEIQRLDDEIKQHGSEKDRMEQQVRSLCMKIETLEASEAERESKRTSDKVQNKVAIFIQLIIM
jgi:chromosome segregation ATPase